MAGQRGITRVPRGEPRLRRNFNRLAIAFQNQVGSGLAFDANGRMIVGLDADGGLEFDSNNALKVKIDVDGHELQVVRGGADTLRKCKSVMIEISHGEGMEEEIQDVFKDFTETTFLRSGNDYNHRFVRP